VLWVLGGGGGPPRPPPPHDPSLEYAAEKDEFGAVRRARWFGRV
jgi:hypothetical protein